MELDNENFDYPLYNLCDDCYKIKNCKEIKPKTECKKYIPKDVQEDYQDYLKNEIQKNIIID